MEMMVELNITYDDGENWIKNNQPAVGQFYSVNVDNQKPYNVLWWITR